MGKYVPLTIFLLLGACILAHAASPWKVETSNLKPDGDTGRGEFTATVVDPAANKRVELSARIPLERIYESFVSGDKLVLLGEAHRPQAVVVFDIRLGKPIDWFFCYDPVRITDQWIVYVEFYFAHVAGGEPTDVVLLYDLAKSPLENRLERTPGMRLPPGDLDGAAEHVGVPIYPESNARRRSYDNIVTDIAARRGVLGQGGYALLGTSKLVFMVAEGEQFSDKYNYLVAVDLPRDGAQPASRKVEIPRHRFRKPGPNPNFTTVSRIEAVSLSAVRLYVPASDYGIGSLVVDVP